jgi:hypothetical protein
MISIIICTIPIAYATPIISIQTDKEIYSYGDFLSITIQVSELTGKSAILHIIDWSGKSSSAISIPITQLKTIVPSPYPFESTVYPQGRYTLNIEYSGSSDSAEFELIDSGKIVIPNWVRDFSKYWYNDEISDKEFAKGIEFLIKENIIVVPQSSSHGTVDEVKIPNWVKTSTGWWIQGKISDVEFAKSIEYLINIGIIIL